ncbi:hypothetical protein Nepgr_025573 [Nepenthes gracilis]|uniref:Uncharacterized protein n=1 Tax=Nepenthes gracilis TaxID=150966 RepID=A0AAD3Y170_NEPGR|nr:hypothetical protein Nepgr_025573 [Nepenthes gracilis]
MPTLSPTWAYARLTTAGLMPTITNGAHQHSTTLPDTSQAADGWHPPIPNHPPRLKPCLSPITAAIFQGSGQACPTTATTEA